MGKVARNFNQSTREEVVYIKRSGNLQRDTIELLIWESSVDPWGGKRSPYFYMGLFLYRQRDCILYKQRYCVVESLELRKLEAIYIFHYRKTLENMDILEEFHKDIVLSVGIN